MKNFIKNAIAMLVGAGVVYFDLLTPRQLFGVLALIVCHEICTYEKEKV